MLTDYAEQATVLLEGARLAAVPADGARALDDLMAAVQYAATRRARDEFVGSWEEAHVITAGILAAYVLHAALADLAREEGSAATDAAALRAALPALWAPGLSDRLAAARALTQSAGDDALADVAGLLRRGHAAELAPASGHLVRRIASRGVRREALATGLLGTFGPWIAAAGRMARPTALAMVGAGWPKVRVAEIVGITRTTLDSWLAQAAT